MVLPYTQGKKVKKGQYKLVGCPKGGGEQKYNIWMCESSHGSDIDNLVMDYGDGAICNFEGAKSIHVELRIFAGTALPSGGITFKPMLTTDLDATYNDYVPYSGDGRLNENVAEIYDKVEEHETTIGNHTSEIAQINADLTESHKNTFGSPIAITTSEYTVPKDGYVSLGLDYTYGGYAYLQVNGVTMLQLSNGVNTNNAGFSMVSLFVRKGMKLKLGSTHGNYTANFFPLV
jgi:hypothetical protein